MRPLPKTHYKTQNLTPFFLTSDDESNSQMLARDGYEIRKAWCPVTPELLKEIAAIKTDPIFNDNPDHRSDRKRKQATISSTWSRAIRRRLAVEFPALKPSSMVVIESRPGCQRQAAHCDYIPTEDLLALSDEEMPLLFLLAVEPNTTLDVWPRSHQILRSAETQKIEQQKTEQQTTEKQKTENQSIHRTTLQLDAGDAILFRADLVHAGSAYTEANRRVHLYLDNSDHHRDPNRTWIIYKHAPPTVRSLIIE